MERGEYLQMEDMTAKIKEILSDEESMKQLNELAQMFSSPDNSENNNMKSNNNINNNKPSANNDVLGFDISKLMQIQQIMSKTENDKNTDLLLALKPLLKKERRERVDKAVKILKLLAVWNILKESGLLNDFF